jgi:phosphotransferase system enzyme I (PtsI)
MAESQSNSNQQENHCTEAVELTNKIGLHARPAIQLTKMAKRFSSQVRIKTAPESAWIDAKSIVQVMAAKAPRGTRLEIDTTGDDAPAALQALVELVRSNFGEDKTDDLELSAEAGHIASRGIAIGRAVFLGKQEHSEHRTDTIEAESRRLDESIRSVQTALKSLIETADEDIAEVLEFQLALLEDRTWIDPALAAIAEGQSAHSAWVQVIEKQIRQYEASDNAYFRGRISDLADLKQQMLNQLHGGTDALPSLSEDTILITDDLAPSDFAVLDKRYCKGIALKKGSLNSHVALLARSRGIPMLIGLQSTAAKAESKAILDAVEGRLITAPSEEVLTEYRQRLKIEAGETKARKKYLAIQPTLTTGERIYVAINVGSFDDIEQVAPDHCDGIGLVRTEFLFGSSSKLPDDEYQFQAYKKLVEWAGNKPVIFRTLDAGGDKPIEGLTKPSESNPFLGVRGIRLALLNLEVLRTQLSALVRASAFGNLRIMLPMVTIPQELESVKQLLQEILLQQRREDPGLEQPPLGIMVEVPAAAMRIEEFDADFFSIGSNDLAQYVTACDRGEPKIAHLYAGADQAVFELIKRTIDHGRSTGKQVSLCGDMAAQPDYIDALVDLGLRRFSVSPTELARVKAKFGAV